MIPHFLLPQVIGQTNNHYLLFQFKCLSFFLAKALLSITAWILEHIDIGSLSVRAVLISCWFLGYFAFSFAFSLHDWFGHWKTFNLFSLKFKGTLHLCPFTLHLVVNHDLIWQCHLLIIDWQISHWGCSLKFFFIYYRIILAFTTVSFYGLSGLTSMLFLFKNIPNSWFGQT